MQSTVAGVALAGRGNLAVAAPTGSGKTAVFELALVAMLRDAAALRVASSSRPLKMVTGPGGQRSSSVAGALAQRRAGDVKALYIAPIKALCSERSADWAKRFAHLGLTCAELTGDNADSSDWRPELVASADVLFATPEKWDAVTRRWRDSRALVGQVALLMLDEVHMLHEERGATLEALVSRMRMVSSSALAAEREWPAKELRIIALSATLPNVRDVGEWLQCQPEHVFSFGEVRAALVG
jgi:ATP-dependent DNA helicase HFM1/MER3